MAPAFPPGPFLGHRLPLLLPLLICGADHNPLHALADNFFLEFIMAGKKDVVDACVRVRLTPAQIQIIAPALALLAGSHQEYKRLRASRFCYPFGLYPPPRGFDRGCFNQSFMDRTLALLDALNTESQNGRSVKIDTVQIRSAEDAHR